MGRPRDACLPPPPPVGRQGGRGTTGVPPAPAARSAVKTAHRPVAARRPSPHYPTGQSSTQARERRPPVGTAASQRSGHASPSGGAALLSAHTPPGRAARRPGNADLRSARAGLRPAHGASPSGGAALLSTHTPPGRAARRQGNADLRSAPLASGQRTAHRPVAARRSSPHIPHRAEQHAGKGTPTSGRHRCAQRSETTHRPVAVQAPLRTYPTGQSGAQARERRPPVGTRWPPASARRIAPSGGVALLSTHTPPSRAARRQGNADLRSAPLASGQRTAHRPVGTPVFRPAQRPAGPRRHRPRSGRNSYATPCKVRPSPNNGR